MMSKQLVLLPTLALFAATALRVNEDMLDSSCSTRTITDGTICGVATVQRSVTNVLQCGTKRVCARFVGCRNVIQTCQVTVTSPRTCEVLDTCPVTLAAKIAGRGSIDHMENITVTAEVVEVKVERGIDAARGLINSNRLLVMPMLNAVINAALPGVNRNIRAEVDKLKGVLIDTIKKQNIGRFFSVVNSVDAENALEKTLNRTFSTLAGDIAPRQQLEKAPVVENWRNRLCHRHLRVRVEDGATYVIRNWTDAIFARKYDEAKECDTVYSAQCGSGIVIKKKQCPFQPVEVHNYCLWGAACWRKWYTVKGSPTKAISIPQSDGTNMLAELGKSLFVDHVSQDSEQKDAIVLSGADPSSLGDLDEQVNMQVPGFQENFVKDMCDNSGADSLVPSFRTWRCRGLLNTLCHWAAWRGSVPVAGMDDIKVKVSLQENFTVSFVPQWTDIERKVEQILIEELSKQSFPMDARVTSVDLELGGSGKHLEIEPESTVFVEANIDMGGIPLPSLALRLR